MNLSAIKNLFYELSGRIDMPGLTVEEYVKSGQRFLDDAITGQHLNGKILKQLVVNTTIFSLPSEPKVLEEVCLYDAYGVKVNPIPITSQQMQLLSDTLPTFATAATPSYYSLVALRHVPEDVDITLEMGTLSGKFPVIETAVGAAPNAIMFDCPTDKEYLLEVNGKFYTLPLVSDVMTNWWADKYPFTLTHAALYMMEVGYRNREGATDWLAAIGKTLAEINNNSIEQDSYHVTRMEG